jgi:tRNA G18 (ribose-2'-O)-methylase SpoU
MTPDEPGTETARTTAVRCPADDCGALFELDSARLGRSAHCPRCGVRLTARPAAVEEGLREQERRITGGLGAGIERLPLAVVVDNVRSLWNVGSIFRSADACGVRHLVLCGITGFPPRPEIAKTALGAERAVRWSYRVEARDAVLELREQGFAPWAVETTDRSTALDDVSWPARVCLVVGNEVAGVSQPVLDACVGSVRIPMFGVKDSYNVAVAFGIVAHRVAGRLAPAERRP